MKNNASQFIKQIAWDQLKLANRATLEPFQLELEGTDTVLYCREIARIMPGKRLVAFGSWDDKSVVAKLFYEPRKALRHQMRDARGIKALLASGVLTPPIYFQGRSKDKRIQVLIFEHIHGRSLDNAWQEKNNLEEINALMHAVIIELATQHVLGILQHDLHFKNFIIRKKNIFMLDGGDIDIFVRPLTKKESLDNLGLFFAQFGMGTETLQSELFLTYARSRGWLVKDRDLALLKNKVNSWQQHRLSEFKKKLMRNCSAFVRLDSYNTVTMYDRDYESSELLACLKNPDVIFSANDTEILKDGRSATVAKVYLDGRAMVMKRYNVKDSKHWLRRCLRPTRAATGWRLAQCLRLMGIATAKPVAFVEKSFLGLRGRSYLLMDYVHGKHLGEYIADHRQDSDAIADIAQKVISLFESLAQMRITHGDLKMTNILVENHKPIFIDLDGMQEHSTSWLFKRTLRREISRFMMNWRDMPTVTAIFQPLIKEMYQRLGV
ncbi:MAG: lipopolysaccharide kinase InaA family protein [Gammaproteobacteria bacterium]|nr:lipopolysaccharide kinase InaA family protein [Gammaproteobacteria bacterium]